MRVKSKGVVLIAGSNIPGPCVGCPTLGRNSHNEECERSQSE